MTERTTAPALTTALAPYVPNLVAQWAVETPGERVRVVDGSLLSADISGFTALSERLAGMGRAGAEELTDLLNRCFTDMIATATSFGGDVLKFGGDALLILFRDDDHAARACSAAIGMRAAITKPLVSARAGRVKLRMSQGIHSGPFTLFLVEGDHRELFVTGPGATETVDCEAEANAGDILLSAAAAKLVEPGWLGEDRGARVLLRRRQPGMPIADVMRDDVPAVDLRPFLSAVQGEQIRAGVQGEHRRATIAFVKFTHTDEIIERDGPDAFAARLQRVTEIVTQAAAAHLVHWLATDVYADGGKFILAAGAPSSSGQDDDDMLQTLREIFDADLPLRLQAGVNRGPVFVGDLGSSTRRTLTVMGDTVNLAARLMQKAEPGQVVVSRGVLERAETRFETTELEPFFVKGKSQPIEASVLGARIADTVRHIEIAEDAPFVGREAELTTLHDALAAAAQGHAYAVELIGEPGIGKSRLVGEFRAREQPEAFLTITCGQYLRATPYLAIRPVLRTLGGIAADADAAEAGERLTAWVHDVAPHLEPWLPLLAIPFDAEVPATPESDRIAEEFRRARLEAALLELLIIVMPQHGVLFVEDAYWLDDASHGLLNALVDRATTWLVVCTRRPGSTVLSVPNVEQVILEPLPASATSELVALLADQWGTFSAAEVAALTERAGGNPLFAVELVAAAAAGTPASELPDSIEQLLTARIDLLDPADRALLRDASVLGARVDTVLLAEAIGDDAVRSVNRWDALAAFVAPDEEYALRFRHALYRAVAYEGLSYRRRVEVHRSVAHAIERRAADPRAVAGYLSMHFDACADYEPAWRYSILAGADARAKYANVEAAQFLRRALDSAGPARVAADDAARVAEDLGDVLELLSRYDEADDAYTKARVATPDPVASVRLLRKHARLRERRSQYTGAVRWLERARREAAQSPVDQDANLVDIAIVYGAVRYRQCRYRDAVEWAREAARNARVVGDKRGLAHALDLLELARLSYPAAEPEPEAATGGALAIYEELGDLVGQTSVLSNLALAAHGAGRWDEAVLLNERSRDIAEQAGDAGSVALALCNLGEVLCDQGRADEARLALVESRRAARASSFEILIGATTLYLGRVEVRAGHFAEAMPLLDEALECFERISAASFVVETQIERAQCLLALESPRAALALLDAVVERASRADEDLKIQAALHRTLALAHLADGSFDAASAAVAHAQRLAAAASAVGEEARAHLVRGAIAEALGDGTTAADELGEATRLFAELGVVDGDLLVAAARAAATTGRGETAS